jgi:NtrC-family two-component system sensor histidine kinase KinB
MFLTILAIIIALAASGTSVYLLLKDRTAKTVLEKREQDIGRRMFELAILKELGDRIGYSLDVQQIIDIITNSLHQFIDYSAVSYMLLEPEKVIFKIHLERSVDRRFVTTVRERMLGSLSALLDQEFDKKAVKEVLSGAILSDELDEPVRSFFNIPLVIAEKVVGILTVADTKAGLYKEEEMTILYKIIQQASKAVTSLQGVVKTEQAKVSAMVKSMEDGVVMTDMDYRILVINPAAKRVIGLPDRNDLTIFDFIDNLGGKVDIRGRLEESVKLKKTFVSEKVLIKDKFYQVFVYPVKTHSVLNEEDVLGGVVIFHDVTHEMELEKVREDFTSMIVHELRTPLDGIKKFSEILKKPGKKQKADTAREYIKMIYQNSSSMLDLVNDILDIAKLQAGKFEINPELADITDVVNNRVQFFELTSIDRKVALRANVSEGIPKTILFDIPRIKEVLNNLVSNALKFTKEGGEVVVSAFIHDPAVAINAEVSKAKVHLPAELPADLFKSLPQSLVVIVSDNGAGIAPEQIGQLFNKFKQLNNKEIVTSVKGTGLGLAVAKGIVEEHKGKIGVVSNVGVGSAFYFVLPLASN